MDDWQSSPSGRVRRPPLYSDPNRAPLRAVVAPRLKENQSRLPPAEYPITQVAELVMRRGRLMIMRTGIIQLEELKEPREAVFPIPVALPNDHQLLANLGIATVLPFEVAQIAMPLLSDIHRGMLRDIETEERRIESFKRRLGVGWDASGRDLPQVRAFKVLAKPFYASRSSWPLWPTNRRGHVSRLTQRDEPLPKFPEPIQTARLFFHRLRLLSQMHPYCMTRVFEMLVQLLVDNILDAEEFCRRIEGLAGVEPHPNISLFLKKYMPEIRRAMYLGWLNLDGVQLPSRDVAFPPPPEEPEPVEVRPTVDQPPLDLPLACVLPIQPLPLDNIPYDMPMPLTRIKESQAQNAGLLSMSKTIAEPGDLHLYSPHVGYVHLRRNPVVNCFKFHETTVKLVSK